jgi:hypothetical protein
MKWSNHPSGNLGVTLSGRSYAEMPRFGRSLTLPGVSISRSSQMVLIFAPFLSVCQSQRYLSSNRAHAASETLGTPVAKFATDDVRPDFGCKGDCFCYVLNDSVSSEPRSVQSSRWDGAIFLRIPGTSCLATIGLSLRDKIHLTAVTLLKLALMSGWPRFGRSLTLPGTSPS